MCCRLRCPAPQRLNRLGRIESPAWAFHPHREVVTASTRDAREADEAKFGRPLVRLLCLGIVMVMAMAIGPQVYRRIHTYREKKDRRIPLSVCMYLLTSYLHLMYRDTSM